MEKRSSLVQHVDELVIPMRTGPDVRDITDELSALVTMRGIREGLISLTVIGSTGSVTTIEHEPGVVQDLKDAIARLAPPGIPYAHEQAWHDDNGHSHIQAALLGPSLSLVVHKGRLTLGTWQQVVLINHDTRARERHVAIHLLGSTD